MSHFTCFTVGDVDEIMAPYNEQDEKYYTPVEYTEEEINETLSHLGDEQYNETNKMFLKEYPEEEDRTPIKFYAWYEDTIPCYDEDTLKQYIDKKRKCFLVKDGKIVKSYQFYNTNAKYDYYGVIGDDPFCRFGGVGFRMKDGSTVQSGRIGDMDIDGIIAEEVESRRKHYREVVGACGEFTHTPWSKYMERKDKGDISADEARVLYNAQPGVNKFKEWCKREHYWLDADDYLCTEDEYIEFATVPVFCANILGKWIEKGEMGWWGMVIDEKEPKSWKDVIETALRDAQKNHPDAVFHVLDCHI